MEAIEEVGKKVAVHLSDRVRDGLAKALKHYPFANKCSYTRAALEDRLAMEGFIESNDELTAALSAAREAKQAGLDVSAILGEALAEHMAKSA